MFFFYLSFVAVESEDEAVAVLASHFTQVIDHILSDTWSHLQHDWISKKTKQKVYVLSRDEADESRTHDNDPHPFFLSFHRMGQKLHDLRLTVIQSFRNYDFTRITPITLEIFPDGVMWVADSGINELFPPPKRGRPRKSDNKKRKRPNFDVEYIPTNTSSMPRNLRRRGRKRLKPVKGPVVDISSSDTNKVLTMADILLLARDLKTDHWKVFVEWDDRPLKEASWTPLTNLSKEATQWWHLLRECRYPQFDDNMFPSLAISGPLRAIDPSTSDENDSSSEWSDT
jgi:hypothetical protein